MKPEWISVTLLGISMLAGLGLAIDRWVHGRQSGETKLARDVAALTRKIEDKSTIWDRSVEVGQTVQALQTMVNEVKSILERATTRDDRQREHFNDMKVQIGKIEEHLKSTDREVVSLGTDLDSLRRWMVETHGQRKS